MAAEDTYIRAKKDKPGHCCACGCLEGKFCQRWWVLSATGIAACAWIFLEDGVSIKYDASFRLGPIRWAWQWLKVDDDIPIRYQINRQAIPFLNQWTINIIQGPCFVRATIKQELDEQLWEGDDDIPFDILGTCDPDPPIETLNARSYKTEAAAVADFPNLQKWDWD